MKGKTGGRYFQRGARWWIAYHDGHAHEIRESCGRNADESAAQKLLTYRLKQTAKSQLDGTEFTIPKARRLSVSDALERFKTEYTLRGKWNDQTLCDWRIVKDRFGTMSCERITKQLLTEFQLETKQAAIQKHPNRRPDSCHGIINRRVWLLLKALRICDLTPPRVERLPEHYAKQGFFEPHEISRVLAHLPQHVADAVTCLALTGWRLSEVVGKRVLGTYKPGLTWADKVGDALRIPAERHKNRRPKQIPLTGQLAELIARRERVRVAGCDLIFSRPDGKPIGDFHRPWARACKLAGCPGRLLHDLRRTRARSWARAGVPEKIAMEIAGWKTRHIFDRYNVVSENDMRRAQEKTEAYLHTETERQLKQISVTVQ